MQIYILSGIIACARRNERCLKTREPNKKHCYECYVCVAWNSPISFEMQWMLNRFIYHDWPSIESIYFRSLCRLFVRTEAIIPHELTVAAMSAKCTHYHKLANDLQFPWKTNRFHWNCNSVHTIYEIQFNRSSIHESRLFTRLYTRHSAHSLQKIVNLHENLSLK